MRTHIEEDVDITVIKWKNGEPEKDGKYYVRIPRFMRLSPTKDLEHFADIFVLDFTVRYGWCTVRHADGTYSIGEDYTPERNEKMWSRITGWAEVEVIEE